jgi:biotin carboxylase
MRNLIVFVGGGQWQKPFMSYLKSKGHEIAVVNPVETPTTTLADIHIKADVHDLDAINSFIKELSPLCITSDQSDPATLVVSRLSERWGLPANPVDTVLKLSDKVAIFRFARSLGISVPDTELVADAEELRCFSKKHGFPIVLKPADATMSRGFRKLTAADEITDEMFCGCLRFSKHQKMIAQVFVDGDMVTLEGVCSSGKHRTVAMGLKTGFFKPGINSGVRYPWLSEQAPELCAVNDRYVEGTRMRFGLTHAEYIIDGENWWLIEIGGRGGGAGIADKIVPWVSGVNTYEVFYESLMGGSVDLASLKLLNRAALLRYYQPNEVANCGNVLVSTILGTPGVAAFHPNFIGQQYVRDNYDCRHAMGIYLAETQDDLDAVEHNIQSQLRGSIPA